MPAFFDLFDFGALSFAASALPPLIFRRLPPAWLEDSPFEQRLCEYPRAIGPGCLAASLCALPLLLRTESLQRQLIYALLLALSAFDALKMVIPDQLLLAICLAALPGASGPGYVRSLLAGACFPLTAAACAAIAALTGRETPIGFGDAKLMFSACLAFGAEKALFGLAYGSMLCGAFAAASLAVKSRKKTDRVAFGPFIVVGIFIAELS